MPAEIASRLESGLRLWQAGQVEAAKGRLRLALSLAELVGSAAGALSAHQLLGGLAHAEGRLGAAWEHHSYVLTRSRALGLQLGVASALHNLGLVAAQQSDLLVARSLLDAAATAYLALGRRESADLVRANLAHLLDPSLA